MSCRRRRPLRSPPSSCVSPTSAGLPSTEISARLALLSQLLNGSFWTTLRAPTTMSSAACAGRPVKPTASEKPSATVPTRLRSIGTTVHLPRAEDALDGSEAPPRHRLDRIAALLLSALLGVAPAGDPYLWLEDVHGTRAMAWVKAENAKTLAVLKNDPNFAGLYADALKIAAGERPDSNA